jgi:hypothetical protein
MGIRIRGAIPAAIWPAGRGISGAISDGPAAAPRT